MASGSVAVPDRATVPLAFTIVRAGLTRRDDGRVVLVVVECDNEGLVYNGQLDASHMNGKLYVGLGTH